MTSGIELSGALRTNLASLNKTQSLIDETQKRLATGLKVSSALDSPQNFFAAQGLDNRASDLSRLLDGIGQSISVLNQTDNALTGLNDLINQAESIATSAEEALGDDDGKAKAVGNVDVSGLTDIAAQTGITAGDDLAFEVFDEDGQQIAFAAGNNSVEISAGDSIDILASKINNLRDGLGNAVLNAEITTDGHLSIESLTGGDFSIDTTGTGDAAVFNNLGLANLNAGSFTSATPPAINDFSVTVSSSTSLDSQALRTSNGSFATADTTLADLTDRSGASLFTGAAGDTIQIGVNGEALQDVLDLDPANSPTISDLVNAVNSNSALQDSVRASYDEKTGEFSLQAIGEDVSSIQVGIEAPGATPASANFGFGNKALTANATATTTESFTLPGSVADVATLESDYNNVLSQIDELVSDASYRGTNLLTGDELETTFNEDRTSGLTTEGTDFSSTGLGLSEASFGSLEAVESALSETRDATLSVRSFGQSIASDLSIIQSRQDFTTSTISTLQDGADKLTQADVNEEGANLLALQTRQQLGTTALSLASQSQQAVLRLF